MSEILDPSLQNGTRRLLAQPRVVPHFEIFFVFLKSAPLVYAASVTREPRARLECRSLELGPGYLTSYFC